MQALLLPLAVIVIIISWRHHLQRLSNQRFFIFAKSNQTRRRLPHKLVGPDLLHSPRSEESRSVLRFSSMLSHQKVRSLIFIHHHHYISWTRDRSESWPWAVTTFDNNTVYLINLSAAKEYKIRVGGWKWEGGPKSTWWETKSYVELWLCSSLIHHIEKVIKEKVGRIACDLTCWTCVDERKGEVEQINDW